MSFDPQSIHTALANSSAEAAQIRIYLDQPGQAAE